MSIRDRLAALGPEERAALEARLLGRRRAPAAGPAIPPLDPAAGAPLTGAQRRLWVVDQLDPGNPAYTLSWAYRIEGDLDAAALAAAFDALVDRHPVLAYVITMKDGEPWQAPGPVRPALTVEPMTPAEADAAALAEARHRFDLAAGPLTRARLLRVGEREHRLVLTLHHILADRWSVAILLRDLLALHEGGPLPPAPTSYAAYAAWQHARPAGGDGDLAYWRDTLAGLPDVLDLPADRPRPAVRDNAGRRLLFDLDERTASGVRALAAGRRATPFMVLAAAVQALLARYTGRDDIPIGTPVSSRPDPSLDGTVGLFLNTLVLRGDLSGDPAFGELVERTRERALGAFEHAALPFETLVEDLSAGRDLSRNPLFQVMLAYQNTPALPGGARGLRLERLDVRPGTAMFDLDLIVEERPGGGLLCVLDYPTDLFDDDRMARLAGHLRTLLAAAVTDPGLRLSELPLMDHAERERTLLAGHGDALPYPEGGVHELVAAQAARTPHATAVADAHGGGLTYAELEAEAGRLAARLRRLGVRPETRVGVCLPRTPSLVAALLGVLKAGGCYVPLDPEYPPDRLAEILADSGAALVVTTGDLEARLPGAPARLLLRDVGLDGESFSTAAHPDQAAYLIYTSGSTGRAKGVMVPHRGLVSLLEHVRGAPGPARDERYLFLTSVSFDIAMIEIFGPLVTGGTVVVAATGEIEQVHRLVKDGALHTVQATPSMLESLLPALAARVPRVVSTGEALPAGLAVRLLEVTDELWDLYGPTETTVWSTGHRVTGDAGGSIGRPVANTSVYVVDEGLRPVPVGVPGELLLGGAGVARGYHGRAGLTAERFVPDPFGSGGRLYRTGDLVRWRESGELEYLGRLDDQVKVRGVRVEPDEVAAVLGEHPSVARAAVVVRDDAPGGRGLVAYVQADTDSGTLRTHLKGRLPEAMIPVAFVPVAAFPVLPSGKLDRKALPPPPLQETRRRPPGTPAEHALHAVWAELLGRDDLGVDDDFFALGGHSLLAMRLVVRMREELGAEVTLRRCFETPTIAALAPLLTTAAAAPIPEATEPVRPSHAQARLWFLDRLDPGNPAYNVAWAERLTGPLQVEALAAAFDDLVDRHDALRLVIADADGEPRLAEGVRRPRLAVRGDDGTGDIGRAEARHRFDLAAGPLARAVLVKRGDDEHDLFLTLHHVIADRWSLSILLRDLMELYRARVTGGAPALPELRTRYRDFAAWHRARAGDRAGDLAYWKDTLADLPATLNLPADRQRHGLPAMTGRRLTFGIDAGTAAAIRAFAAERQATPFMVLLAALQAVLARYTGRDDIPIGTPVSGRSHPDAEELAGLFLNTLVLRGDLSGDPGLGELVERTRERVLDAHDHAELPFEVLVRELAEERDLSRNPLFQVMLAYQNVPPAPAEAAGVTLRTLDVDPGVTQADLHLVIEEGGDGLTAVLHYATDVFDHDRMERFAGHFRAFLARAIADPARPVRDVPLLTPEEQETIRRANDTAVPYEEATLTGLLAAQAARTPHAPALRWRGEWLTYEQFTARVRRLAGTLRRLGAGPDQVVGVCLERGPDLVVAVHAVVAAGAAYLPLEPDHPPARLAGMAADAGARLVITRTGQAVPDGVTPVLVDDDHGPAAEVADVHPDALAYVIFTSGSTGRPKGVGVSHRAIANRLRWMQDAFPLTGEDRVAFKTPFSFDVSVWELFWPLITGAGMVVAEPGGHADPGYLARLFREADVGTVHFVPSMLDAYLDEPGLPPLRRVICSGEALTPELAARLHERMPGTELHNLYGPTEAAVDVTWHACAPGETVIPIGRPVANTRLEILDERMRPAPVGVPGTLWIGGVQLARGYAGRPALTAERFRPGPDGNRLYDTGDLARWRPDGEIEYLGRADHQVKIRGIRVELGEVEAALTALPGVRAAAARTVADGAGLRLAGYVVPEPDPPGPQEWDALLRENLPAHLVPATLTVLDALPLNRSGKLDRDALPDPALPRPEEHAEPEGDAEHAVAAAWQDVLGLARVSAHDNFFAAGGDSIRSLKVLARLREAGYTVRLEQLFLHQTVRELAARLEPARPDNEPRAAAPFGLLDPEDLARMLEGEAR